MRGNVGFPLGALGEVRLGVGQGITGLAVEYMRPISLNTAATHASYRHFPGLGEEAFPIFLAVPISGPQGPLGALVLQRRAQPAFDPAEVELAAALTAPIAALVDRARLVDALRGEERSAPRGTRRVTLSGRSVVKGRALGVIHAFPRPESRPVEERHEPSTWGQMLEKAVGQARRVLEAVQEAAASPDQADSEYLEGVHTILADARIAERALELAEKRKGLSHALLDLGAEALRTAQNTGSDFGVQRARLIADVCEALSVLVLPQWNPRIPRGAVLVGDHFAAFDLLISMQLLPAAVVLSDAGAEGPSRQLLGFVRVPAVVDVAGLFQWSHAGELALVDADHGMVRLNPSRLEVSTLRQEKKSRA
jgi:phosphotransferase system enzyme I (PtsP)